MKVLGITGGIGSGKSIVCEVFTQIGIPVFNADVEARDLYYTNVSLAKRLRDNFPPELFLKDGTPDRKKFAGYFFNNHDELDRLNSLVHPVVREQFKSWAKKNHHVPYIIKEAAILFESGAFEDCDRVATVSAPEELRMQRVMERDNRKKEEVLKILKQQWSDKERSSKADYEIRNDETEMVLPQVLNIHKQMMKLSKGE